MKISILGTGWLGQALFKSLVINGSYTVFGSSRNAEKRQHLLAFAHKYNKQHQLFALNVPDIQSTDLPFFDCDVLIITIPPGRKRDDVAKRYPSEIKTIVEAAEKSQVKHIIYTSSTGVYGNQEGIVDEETSIAPTTNSAIAVANVEAMLMTRPIPISILRLAGLYGLDRHPGRWFANRESLPNADAPVNLVHQTDVVKAIECVITSDWPAKTTVYNVCAAAHPAKKDFYPTAIQHYGGSVPALLSGGAAGKRVRSEKIRKTLGWQPVFDLLNGY